MLRTPRNIGFLSVWLAICVVVGPIFAAAPPVDPAGVEFFETKIRPVLADNCFKCHSAASPKLKAELHLDTREGMLKGGESEVPALVPGDIEKSMLVKAVRYTDKDLQMPPKSKLSDEQIASIEAWVKMGAPMPAPVAGVATSDFGKLSRAVATTRPVRMTLEEGRKFWSFIPVHEQVVPDVKNDWAKNEIDRFILAKLTEKQLAPSARADKRTLIRRATFDLLGLPPSPKEIDDFEADQSTDAFSKVVDRLLASPHYGERWGRYWLDVARYADTKGYVFEEERRYPFAYTYRDWVVKSLNDDLPYDQFLIQQIAADKLDFGKDKRPLAAMGFLTVGRRFLNAVPDIIDDRIDVVTRGTMALTVSCARCHDHKYDPIPTADYYSLYGVFASSREPAELPALTTTAEKSPETIAFEKEFAAAEAEVVEFRTKRFTDVSAQLRMPQSIAKYLTAAQELLQNGDQELKLFAKKHEVRRWLLLRWRDYLKTAADQNRPVFAIWTACVKSQTPPIDLQRLAAYYGPALSKSADAPFNVTLADADQVLDGDDKLQLGRLKQKADAVVATHPGSPSRAMTMEDADIVAPHIFVRGNAGNVGAEVPRQFPAILSPDKREPFKEGSGRLELARNIASKDNPLTARVMVNRVWMYHFASALVRTPSDFGTRGEKPTHPELLDWLAKRFAEDDGWSIKKLHKRIMLSAAYQQGSVDNAQARAVDPENRLLWRMNPRRLDFEAMRDSLLAVSGKIDLAVGGKPVDILAEPFVARRTLYAFVDRQNLPGMFRTFDFASPDATSPQRFTTSVPQQALFMINSPFVIEQARTLANRKDIAAEPDPRKKIEQLYRAAIGRKPADDEVALAAKFIDTEQSQPVELVEKKSTAWQYGYGDFDDAAGQLKKFENFPHFTGSAWQGGPELPNPKLGWAMLTSSGGHPGDAAHCVVRRWIAPRDCTVSIGGTLSHAPKEGNGIRGRIVTPRESVLASWIVQRKEVETKISGVEMKQGEAIDFIVDSRGDIGYDQFEWKIAITKVTPAQAIAGDDSGSRWDAVAEFSGPAKKPAEPMTPWEKYAQVLLQSNEFLFVD